MTGGWGRRCGWRVGNRGCDGRVGEVWLEGGNRRCDGRVGEEVWLEGGE